MLKRCMKSREVKISSILQSFRKLLIRVSRIEEAIWPNLKQEVKETKETKIKSNRKLTTNRKLSMAKKLQQAKRLIEPWVEEAEEVQIAKNQDKRNLRPSLRTLKPLKLKVYFLV
jgi:hypothetical protein